MMMMMNATHAKRTKSSYITTTRLRVIFVLLLMVLATAPFNYCDSAAAAPPPPLVPPRPTPTTVSTDTTTSTTRGGASGGGGATKKASTIVATTAAKRRKRRSFQLYLSSTDITPFENRFNDVGDVEEEDRSPTQGRVWGKKNQVEKQFDELKRDLEQKHVDPARGGGGEGGGLKKTTLIREIWNKGTNIGWNVLESVSRLTAVAAVALPVVAGTAFRGGGSGISSSSSSSSSSSWSVDTLARSLVVLIGQIVIFQSLASILTTNDFHVLDQVVSRVLDPESKAAIKTVREIINASVHDHGVVDVFQKYKIRDVTSSIYALSRLQRAAQHWQRLQVMQSTNDGDDHDDQSSASSTECYPIVKDAELLEDLAHYAVYANTVYGWTMDLVFGGGHKRRLWPFGRRRQRQGGGDGTNGSLLTLLRRTGIRHQDVVAAVWESKTHRPAYFLVHDHAKQALVLCVRGTYSAHDVLTDLCCTAEEFEPLSPPPTLSKSTRFTTSTRAVVNSNDISNNIGDPKRDESWTVLAVIPDLCFDIAAYCRTITSSLSSVFLDRRQRCCGHHGMLQAARALHQDVEALVRAELEAHPAYALVLVGHSMGGGVASLLSILWQDLFDERLGAVYLYGAPCVAPLDARPTGTNGNSTNDKIMSVVMHGDPFGRWSLGHVADVSIDLAHLCDNEELRRVIFLHTDGKTRDLDKSDLQWCAATMQELRQHRRRNARSNTSAGTWTTKATPIADAAATEATTLYPPGRILYLSQERNKETHAPGRRLRGSRHSKKRTTIVRQVPPEFFQDLIISPSMFDLTKHVPALYESSLRTAAIHARS